MTADLVPLRRQGSGGGRPLPGYRAVEPERGLARAALCRTPELERLRPGCAPERRLSAAGTRITVARPTSRGRRFAAACGSTLGIFALPRLPPPSTRRSRDWSEAPSRLSGSGSSLPPRPVDYTIGSCRGATAHDELNLVTYYGSAGGSASSRTSSSGPRRAAAAWLPRARLPISRITGGPSRPLLAERRGLGPRPEEHSDGCLGAGGAWSRLMFVAFRMRSATWFRW